MLKPNRVKQKVAAGEAVYGLFCSIPHPTLVEMIGAADYDFVIIDAEHVLINPETLENMIRAAEVAGLTAFVRVPDKAPNTILKVLDAGAQGVVVPHVRNAEEAREIVKASRYFPQGERSLNGGRPALFGKKNLVAYLEEANAEILVIPMIENREGVENIEEILAVLGVDMILEGAADLSQSYGVPWQTRGEVVREKLQLVQEAAARHGVSYIAIPRAAEDITLLHERGIRAFVLGEERGTAFRALQAHLSQYQSKLEDN